MIDKNSLDLKESILFNSGMELNESDDRIDNIHEVLYAIMVDGTKVAPFRYKATLDQVLGTLEFKPKLSEADLKRYLDIAVEDGFVERDDNEFVMTKKAGAFIKYQEE